MVSEHRGRRIRPAERIHEGPERVDDAPRHEQRRRPPAGVRLQVGQGHDADPPQRDIAGRAEPFRRVDPEHVKENVRQRAGPHEDQEDEGERPRQHQHAERGVAARDQHADHRVVEPCHPAARALRPRDAMEERAHAEERGQAHPVDRGDDDGPPRRRAEDEHGPGHEGDEERVVMEHAAQPGSGARCHHGRGGLGRHERGSIPRTAPRCRRKSFGIEWPGSARARAPAAFAGPDPVAILPHPPAPR